MSLYGALFSGVSGLRAQSSKIGIISDNISNVNTVGYKGGSGIFQSLVTTSATTSAYSPGGVLGGNRQLISQQGLLQSTNSATDIAISGGGFFVVNQAADGSGQVLYTRAGSFRQDSTGNFRNAAGFFLQAWPLDREGRLPGEPGNLNTSSSANLSSLRTVNVQNLTGVAAATSNVAISANLNSGQAVFAGAGAITTMDALHTLNFGITAKDIIVPNVGSPVNGIQRGDKFNITTGSGQAYTYRYGGFTFSRGVSTASVGDSGQALLAGSTTVSAATTLEATPFSTTAGSPIVTITQANHGLNTGDSVTLAGNTDNVNFAAANDINGTFIITKIDDDTFTVRMAVNATATNATAGAGAITSTSRVFSVTAGSNVVTVRQVDHGLVDGAVVTFAGNTNEIAGIPAGDLNGTFVVDVIDDDHFTFVAATTAQADDLAATPFSTTAGSPLVTVTHAGHNFSVGDTVTLAGNTDAVNFADANDINGTFVIESVVPGVSYTVRMLVNAAATNAAAGSNAVTALDNEGGSGTINSITRPFVGNILDATNPTETFLGVTGTSGYTPAGLTFKITTVTSGTVTFTYTSSSPNAQLGQFNNMTNLAAAISSVNGLSARVVEGRLYVSATDANEAITFTNGSTVGTSGPPVQAGIDWVRELGLADQAVGVDRFSTLEGLAALINASAGVSAIVENPLGNSALRINVDDPLDTITFSDRPVNTTPVTDFVDNPITTTVGSNVITITQNNAHGFTTGDIVTLSGLPAGLYNGIDASELNGQSFVITVTSPTTYTVTLPPDVVATSSGSTGGIGNLSLLPPTNAGSLLAELGLVNSLAGAVFTAQTTGAIGPAYDPTDPAKNMASGAIPAQFSRPIRVFDALGTGHDLSVNFIKIGVNTWAVEVFALPETDITTSLPNGQLTYGTITFNGDGSLRSLSSLLSNQVNVTWTNGAAPSAVEFNWGTPGQPFGTPGATSIGLTDGLSQFNSAYRVNFVNQNGAPVGELSSVAIDENGFIIASYSNGETQRLFKIPLADFANPDQLLSSSGNVFAETAESGAVNLAQAGSSGVGKIAASSLEASNVELADQLTDMIVAQRAYQANTKVISTSDQLLEELNRVLQ